MAQPASRDEFKEFCLRALGKPVLQINMDDDQVEDRIDEALYVYQQHHMDAVVKTIMKHRVTASTMNFVANSVGTFANNEIITGATSNSEGTVCGTTDANTITYVTNQQTANATVNAASYDDTATVGFIAGEVVTGRQSGATGTISTLVAGDYDRKWIPIPNAVIGVTRVFPMFESRSHGGDFLFDPAAQFNMSLMANFTSTSLIPYVMGRQYQTLMNEVLRGRPAVRFQRHMNRLYIDVGGYNQALPGQWWAIEGYRVIDPDTFTDVWSDRWLQKYAQAVLKKQWGTNLSKFGGIQLPGGVTLNGADMYDKAVADIEKLEAELLSTYTLPIEFFVG